MAGFLIAAGILLAFTALHCLRYWHRFWLGSPPFEEEEIHVCTRDDARVVAARREAFAGWRSGYWTETSHANDAGNH
jgi:hypothetical protein